MDLSHQRKLSVYFVLYDLTHAATQVHSKPIITEYDLDLIDCRIKTINSLKYGSMYITPDMEPLAKSLRTIRKNLAVEDMDVVRKDLFKFIQDCTRVAQLHLESKPVDHELHEIRKLELA